MRVVLDTQILIWAVHRPDRLAPNVAEILTSRDNQVMFSAVNVWEVAIKFALRRPDFTLAPGEVVAYASEAEFSELAVTSSSAARVAALPLHHRDPSTASSSRRRSTKARCCSRRTRRSPPTRPTS